MLNIYSSIALCSGLMECQWTTSMYTCAIYQFHFKFHLSVMQIILMKWSIWTVRNGKIFKQVGPSVGACKAQFKYEPDIVINCMKSRCLSEINIRVNLHFYGHPHFYFHKYQYPARLQGSTYCLYSHYHTPGSITLLELC